MRYLFLLSVCTLAARASTPEASQPVRSLNTLGQAQAYCLSKGYVRGSFEYDVCYRNRPEVQAQERAQRLASLQIIAQNKSYRVARGRSYPVE